MNDVENMQEFIKSMIRGECPPGYAFGFCRKCTNPCSEGIGMRNNQDLDHYVLSDMVNTYKQFFSHNQARVKQSVFGKLNVEFMKRFAQVTQTAKSKALGNGSDRLSIGLIGPPSSGKTVILQSLYKKLSICSECKLLMKSGKRIKEEGLEKTTIHASFFLEDNSRYFSNIKLALLSLCNQLSRNVPNFQCEILPHEIDSTEDTLNTLNKFTIKQAFEELIFNPILNLNLTNPICILLDGIEHLQLREYDEIVEILVNERDPCQGKLAIFFSVKSDMIFNQYNKTTIELRESKYQLDHFKKSGIVIHSLFYNDNQNRVFVRDFLNTTMKIFLNNFSLHNSKKFDSLFEFFQQESSGNIGRCVALHRQLKFNPQIEDTWVIPSVLSPVYIAVSEYKMKYSICPGIHKILDLEDFKNFLLPLLCLHEDQSIEINFLLNFYNSKNNPKILKILPQILSVLNPIFSPNLDKYNNNLLHSINIPPRKTLNKLLILFQELYGFTDDQLNLWKQEVLNKICEVELSLIENDQANSVYMFRNILNDMVITNRTDEIDKIIINTPNLFKNEKVVEILSNVMDKTPMLKANKAISLIWKALLKSEPTLISKPNLMEQILKGRLSLREQLKFENIFKGLNNSGNRYSLKPLTNSLERAILPKIYSLTFNKFSSLGPLINLFLNKEENILTLCFEFNLVILQLKPNSFTEYTVINDYKLKFNTIDAYQNGLYTIVITEQEAILIKVLCSTERQTSTKIEKHKLSLRLRRSSKVSLIKHLNNLLVLISNGNDLIFFLSKRNNLKMFNFVGNQLLPEGDQRKVRITYFSSLLTTKPRIFFGTSLGMIFALTCFFEKNSLKFSFDLCVHVKVQGEEDGIIKFKTFIENKALNFIIASDSGLVGKYQVIQENGRSRAKLLKEVKPAKNRKHRNSMDNELYQHQIALGTSRVITRRGLRFLVEDFQVDPVKYELPLETSTLFLKEGTKESDIFLSLTENNKLSIWDLKELPNVHTGSNNPTNEDQAQEDNDKEEESDDDDSYVDDFDFFLNVNQDIEATDNLVDVNIAVTEDKEEEEEEEDDESSEEEDDDDFFLSTNKEIGLESSMTPTPLAKSDTLSVSVISSGAGSRGRKLFSKHRMKFKKVEYDIFPQYWYSDWVSCITINEPKAVAAIGYKDGRLAIFSLNSSFFDKRKAKFGVVGLTNDQIQLVSARNLEAEISSIEISESGQYLACYTRTTLRVFALSRGGYKVGKDKIEHLSYLISHKRENNFQKEIFFSECTNYVKLAAFDENSVASLVIDLKSRRRVQNKMLPSLAIKWEYKSHFDGPEVEQNVVKQQNLEFHMDGKENVLGLHSPYWKVIVVAQGSNLHFLGY